MPSFNTKEPIDRATVNIEDAGSITIDEQHEYTQYWTVHVVGEWVTAADLQRSYLLPRRGDLYARLIYDPSKRSMKISNGRLAYGEVIDQNSTVSHVSFARRPDTKNIWDVVVDYSGQGNPGHRPPHVVYRNVPYEEVETTDIHGQLFTNSAYDPYESGLPRSKKKQEITITQSTPPIGMPVWIDELWDEQFGYQDTLNAAPFQLPTPSGPMTNRSSIPTIALPGTMLLKSIDFEFMPRRVNPIPSQSTFFLQTTAVLEWDRSTFINNDGIEELRRHRHIVADEGYNQIIKKSNGEWKKEPILKGGPQIQNPVPLYRKSTGEVLPAPEIGGPPNLPGIFAGNSTPLAPHRFYAGLTDATLSVDTFHGLLRGTMGQRVVNHGQPMPSPGGSLSVDTDGSFTYSNAIPGYYTFTYRIELTVIDKNGQAQIVESNNATVVIRVGERPRVRIGDRYRTKDWGPILSLLNTFDPPLV